MGDRSRGEIVTKVSLSVVLVPLVASFFPAVVSFVFGVDTDLSEIGRTVRLILMWPMILISWFGRRHLSKLE